jgi:L-fucose isomerase-like protein
MQTAKTTFALFFGNRGFFPGSLIAAARQEMSQRLLEWGYGVLMMDESATRYGAVETPEEGARFASFLRANQGKYAGVIVCLPNFGDETGAVTALKDAGTPILIQAYPDDLDRMAPALRRDAFCGKLSIMDVFNQYGVKFTALKPHVVKVSSPAFQANVDHFERVCRVANGMRGMVVGAIGARTTYLAAPQYHRGNARSCRGDFAGARNAGQRAGLSRKSCFLERLHHLGWRSGGGIGEPGQTRRSVR